MKAVIIAAGEGKRLYPLTADRPKPLVKVLGKTLIQHTWEVLPHIIDEVVVVIGHKGDMMREFLGDEFLGKRVTYVEQKEQLGTAHALKLCKTHLENEEKFLLMYADDIHAKSSVEKCFEYEHALLAAFVDDPRRFGVVVMNDDGAIADIEEKPEFPKSKLAVTGVYVLTPKIFNYDAEHMLNGEYYLTDMIARYAKDYPMQVVASEIWIPIGYPEDVVRAEELLLTMNHE